MKKLKYPTSIRLEKEILEKIKRIAKEERRSVSEQISYMIIEYKEKDTQ